MNEEEIRVATKEGDAVATKESHGGPWHIGYPWGDKRFYGTRSEVRREMIADIRKAQQEVTNG